jgi:hypothetical protein
MAETRRDADIDLTVVPAQRASVDDKLEIIHHAAPPAVVPRPQARAGTEARSRPALSAWLVAVCASLVVGGAVGVVLGAVVSSDEATSVPSSPTRGGDLTSLLLAPVTSAPAQPAAPTDAQDLIARILSPSGSH